MVCYIFHLGNHSDVNTEIITNKVVEIKKGKHLCSIECSNDVNITFKNFLDQHNE